VLKDLQYQQSFSRFRPARACFRVNCYVNLIGARILSTYFMKIAAIFFIIGMLLLLFFFKTTFVTATQNAVDFHILDSYVIITKSSLYLYITVFFIILTLSGLLISKRIHRVKRQKHPRNTTI